MCMCYLFIFFLLQSGAGIGDFDGQLCCSFYDGFWVLRGNISDVSTVRSVAHQRRFQLLDVWTKNFRKLPGIMCLIFSCNQWWASGCGPTQQWISPWNFHTYTFSMYLPHCPFLIFLALLFGMLFYSYIFWVYFVSLYETKTDTKSYVRILLFQLKQKPFLFWKDWHKKLCAGKCTWCINTLLFVTWATMLFCDRERHAIF